jgi:hypothetical protein
MRIADKTNTIKRKKHIQLREQKSKNVHDDKEREQREAVMHLAVYSTSHRGHRS